VEGDVFFSGRMGNDEAFPSRRDLPEPLRESPPLFAGFRHPYGTQRKSRIVENR
jgi:hypothetical protein